MKKPYREVKIRKRGSKKAFFAICFCFFTFVATIFLSFFASPILNIAKLASTNTYLYENSFYFVMLNTQTNNQEDAKKEAQNIKSRGGAGVLVFGNTYFVVVSCYLSFDDAQKICKTLSTEENPYLVKEQKISQNTKSFLEEERNLFFEYINFFTEKSQEIYALIHNLDKNSTSQISANLKIKSIKNETFSLCQNDILLKSENLQKLKSAFLSFESSLEYASDQSHLGSTIVPYASVLREMLCHSIMSFCEI